MTAMLAPTGAHTKGPTSPIYLTATDSLTGFIQWLAEDHGTLALDTETTGLDTRAPDFEVRQVAFAAEDGTGFVLAGSATELVREAVRLVARSEKLLWAHNADFDRRAMAATFKIWPRLRCSLTLVRTLEPHRIGLKGMGSLKTLRPATMAAKRNLLAEWEAFGGRESTGWLAEAVANLTADNLALLRYVMVDAVECARLVAGHLDGLSASMREVVLREAEIDRHWSLVGHRGFKVDRAMLDGAIAKLEAAQEKSVREHGLDLTRNTNAVRDWVRIRGILIRDLHGSETLSAKHYGRAVVPQSAEADWKVFKAAREVSATANKLTELCKLLGTGDRIFPSIHGIGANTGRMSIGKPALQNLTAELRGLLLADAGMTLVGCDLDRVEPRIVAALSQDARLIEAVQGDVYEELAVGVYGEAARGDEGKRKLAKTAFLAMLYGQGSKSLGANLGISITEAQALLDGLLAAYPVMAAWIAGIKRTAREGRPLTTGFGRPLPETSAAPYRAVNWTVQGTAADLFKALTLRVVDALGPQVLWLPVHDELILAVPDSEAESAARSLGECMTTEFHGVPITGSPVILGKRWGKA